MSKKTRRVLVFFAGVISAIFIFSNLGISGVYKCSMVKRTFKNSQPFLVFKDGKVFAVDTNDTTGISIIDFGTYEEIDGQYFCKSVINEKPLELKPSFRKLDWPFYFEKLKESETPDNDLHRVFNPILKIKLYKGIMRHEGSVLWSIL